MTFYFVDEGKQCGPIGVCTGKSYCNNNSNNSVILLYCSSSLGRSLGNEQSAGWLLLALQ